MTWKRTGFHQHIFWEISKPTSPHLFPWSCLLFAFYKVDTFPVPRAFLGGGAVSACLCVDGAMRSWKALAVWSDLGSEAEQRLGTISEPFPALRGCPGWASWDTRHIWKLHSRGRARWPPGGLGPKVHGFHSSPAPKPTASAEPSSCNKRLGLACVGT